jgi:hypothetical protein
MRVLNTLLPPSPNSPSPPQGDRLAGPEHADRGRRASSERPNRLALPLRRRGRPTLQVVSAGWGCSWCTSTLPAKRRHMTRRGRWSHGGGSAGSPRSENPRELAVQLRIRENALVTQFYGLRHCRSLCFLASQRQLHLLSLCQSCCLSPPARRFRRPPTPTATRAGFPCVSFYAGVTGRGSGRLPACSTLLVEHPGSVGVVEPLKETLARRLGALEGTADAAVLTPRQPLNRHARGQPTAGHTTLQQACLSSCRSPTQLCRAAAKVSSTTRCQPLSRLRAARACRAPRARPQRTSAELSWHVFSPLSR